MSPMCRSFGGRSRMNKVINTETWLHNLKNVDEPHGARAEGWPSAPIAELVHDLLQGQDRVRAGPAEAAKGVQR